MPKKHVSRDSLRMSQLRQSPLLRWAKAPVWRFRRRNHVPWPQLPPLSVVLAISLLRVWRCHGHEGRAARVGLLSEVPVEPAKTGVFHRNLIHPRKKRRSSSILDFTCLAWLTSITFLVGSVSECATTHSPLPRSIWMEPPLNNHKWHAKLAPQHVSQKDTVCWHYIVVPHGWLSLTIPKPGVWWMI